MPKAKVYNQTGSQVGEISLADKVFGVAAKAALVHQAMVAQMANERQVLAHTKGRADVSGGGAKPWKQKGTGRARVGSSRSPLWRGGGITFGPTKERNFKLDINRKMKQKALFMVLSDRVKENNFLVLDSLQMEEYKTKKFNQLVSNLEKIGAPEEKKPVTKKTKEKTAIKAVKRSFLFLLADKDDKVKRSGRNLPGVKILNLENLNIVDLLKYKKLVATEKAVKKLEKTYVK